MVTTKELLLNIFEKFPNIKLQEAQKEIPTLTKANFYKCRRQWLKSKSPPKITKSKQSTKNTKSTKKNPPQEISFIDDPNELLLSVAIRELNKPNPDPRWASILINCKKEKITNTNEVIDQFKNLPTQALVNLLNKSSQEEY